jgi:hypothetical protein
MERLLPRELEEALSGDLHHLILKPDSSGVSARLRTYLDRRNITIRQERVFHGQDRQTWVLLSFDGPSASALAMELIEEGFSVVVAGIDAKSS